MSKLVRPENLGLYLEAFNIAQPRQSDRQYRYDSHLDAYNCREQIEIVPLFDRSRTNGVLIGVVDELVYASKFNVSNAVRDSSGRLKPAICDLCCTQQASGGVRIVNFPSHNRYTPYDAKGRLMCADLRCSLHIRDLTAESTSSRVSLRETETVEGMQKPMSIEARAARLKRNMTALFENLGVAPQIADLSENSHR
jgi:hypothetical protein